MEIRSCSQVDLHQLRSRWPVAGDVHGWHVSQSDADYLVAWEQDEPVGSVVLRWSGPIGVNARHEHAQVPAVLHLQVRPTHRGRGVGSALIGACETQVHDRGLDRLSLTVSLVNTAAEDLYRRLGYQPTGVTDVSEYDWLEDDETSHHEVETDQLLVKELAASRG